MVRYKIPFDVIEKFFVEKACENKKNGRIVETLAFLVGFRENDIITVTDLVFGQQHGNSISVVDDGDYIKFYVYIQNSHNLVIFVKSILTPTYIFRNSIQL